MQQRERVQYRRGHGCPWHLSLLLVSVGRFACGSKANVQAVDSHTPSVYMCERRTWRASIPAAHFCVASLPTDAAAIRVACSTINTHVALFIRASTFPLMVLTIDFCFSQASHNLADMLFAVFMFVGALPIIIAVPTASMNVRMPCDRAQAHPQDSGVESR